METEGYITVEAASTLPSRDDSYRRNQRKAFLGPPGASPGTPGDIAWNEPGHLEGSPMDSGRSELLLTPEPFGSGTSKWTDNTSGSGAEQPGTATPSPKPIRPHRYSQKRASTMTDFSLQPPKPVARNFSYDYDDDDDEDDDEDGSKAARARELSRQSSQKQQQLLLSGGEDIEEIINSLCTRGETQAGRSPKDLVQARAALLTQPAALTGTLTKVRDGKRYPRTFVLPVDETCLRWLSDKKRGSESKILCSRIVEIKLGQVTEEFHAMQGTAAAEVKMSFSIVFRSREKDANGKPAIDTLDLIAESEEDCKRWTSRLTTIVKRFQAVLTYMKRGAPMTKCRPKRQYERTFFLTDDMHLRWEPSKFEDKRLNLADVKLVKIGQNTPAFRRAKNVAQHEPRSFSLVYGDNFETLDLICQNDRDYEVWIIGLNSLVDGSQDSQDMMMKGANMRKVYGNGKTVLRKFYLSKDAKAIFWSAPSQNGSPPSNQRILLSSIKELRFGQKTDVFRNRPGEFDEALSFSIIHGNSYKTLDLVVEDMADFKDWRLGLEDLVSGVSDQLRTYANLTEQQLVGMFQESARIRKKQLITFKQACLKLFQAAPHLATKANVECIRQFAKKKKGGMDLDTFIDCYHEICVNADFNKIMSLHSTKPDASQSSLSYMTVEQLQVFLVQEQRVSPRDASVDHCRKLIQEFEPKHRQSKVEDATELRLSPLGFSAYLCSQHGDAINPLHEGIYQDMTQPLNHYFISSSHNTFLTTDQLKGPSSVEAYIRALQKGCRCLEIDCWDGPNGEPVVYHGHTLTSKIAFRDVISCINDYAFVESPYPLILSLENHCCLQQQKFMATYMKETFGAKLLVAKLDDRDALPSPEELKLRILIKCHKPIGRMHGKTIVAVDDAGQVDYGVDANNDAGVSEIAAVATDLKAKAAAIDEFGDDAGEGDAGEKTATVDKRQIGRNNKAFSMSKKKAEIRLHKDFADIVVYFATVPRFQSFELAYRLFRPWHMTSFAEARAMQLASDPLTAFALAEFNRRCNSRVFPAGTRVDSSNYNPYPMWLVGSQMIALNVQTDGTPMLINQGKFRQNGRCGYVLKPAYLRGGEDYSPLGDPMFCPPGGKPMVLSIRVLAGQHLPRAKLISPFVQLEVIGVPSDCATQRTTVKHHQGMSPAWEEAFQFPIMASELACLRLVVRDFHGKFIAPGFVGEVTVPVDMLREGYRLIRLNGSNAEPLSATLLVHIRKQEAEHSEEYWQKLPLPPVPSAEQIKPLKVLKTGNRALDQKRNEVQGLFRRATLLRERILSLWEKSAPAIEKARKNGTRALRALMDERRKSGGMTQWDQLADNLESLRNRLLQWRSIYEEHTRQPSASDSRIIDHNGSARLRLKLNLAHINATLEVVARMTNITHEMRGQV